MAVTEVPRVLSLLGGNGTQVTPRPTPTTDERDRAADERDREADERDRQADERDREADEEAAVAAHRLLSSSAVVSMAATTLLAHWDGMVPADRVHLLERVVTHASSVDEALKEITQGHLGLAAASRSSLG
jgi:hypothetical protein